MTQTFQAPRPTPLQVADAFVASRHTLEPRAGAPEGDAPVSWRDQARAVARAAGLGEMGTASVLAELGRRGLDLSRVDDNAPPLRLAKAS